MYVLDADGCWGSVVPQMYIHADNVFRPPKTKKLTDAEMALAEEAREYRPKGTIGRYHPRSGKLLGLHDNVSEILATFGTGNAI